MGHNRNIRGRVYLGQSVQVGPYDRLLVNLHIVLFQDRNHLQRFFHAVSLIGVYTKFDICSDCFSDFPNQLNILLQISQSELDPHRFKALFNPLEAGLLHVLQCINGHNGLQRNFLSDQSTHKIVGRHSGLLSHDVIERHINCALGLRRIRSRPIHRFPDCLYLEGIKSDDRRCYIIGEHGHNRLLTHLRGSGKGSRFSISHNSLISMDFHYHKPAQFPFAQRNFAHIFLISLERHISGHNFYLCNLQSSLSFLKLLN